MADASEFEAYEAEMVAEAEAYVDSGYYEPSDADCYAEPCDQDYADILDAEQERFEEWRERRRSQDQPRPTEVRPPACSCRMPRMRGTRRLAGGRPRTRAIARLSSRGGDSGDPDLADEPPPASSQRRWA